MVDIYLEIQRILKEFGPLTIDEILDELQEINPLAQREEVVDEILRLMTNDKLDTTFQDDRALYSLLNSRPHI